MDSNFPKKIFHAGDIHFFLSKKFKEHQFVCNKFYEELESSNPDLCVLTGDLIDSKLRLGPEQIDLCRSFLHNITNHCPLIIILGNHDLNLNNAERLDSISPILYSLYNQTNHPIHFLKHSGIYNLYSIDWAVWSCLDNQKNPFPENYIKENYIIGLYHGAVAGCISENGFVLNDGIEISEFDLCDAVMLSDIHTLQNFRNNTIQYSGSFLQTKLSENPYGSFIQWDWDGKNFKPTIKKLENIYSTISEIIPPDFKINKIPNIISSQQTILLRYDADIMTKLEANEYKNKIQDKYENPVELRAFVRKKFKLNKSNELNDNVSLDIKGYLIEFIKKNKENLGIKNFEEDLLKIFSLDELFSADIDISKDFEYGDFNIQRIVINNLFSFSPTDTEIPWDLEGIVGINAPNRSGKSNILRSLHFILFNSSPNNTSSLKKIINKYNREKPAYGEVYISKNGLFYHIKRTLIPKKKEGVTTTLEFRQVDINGIEIQNLVGEKRQETEKEIQKHFGIESMFEILSVFSAQKKQVEFIDCKNAERLTLVNRFLGLQSFEEKEKNVAEELKKDKAVFEALLNEFSNVSIDALKDSLEESKEYYLSRTPMEAIYQDNLMQLIDNNKGLLELYEETKVIANKKVLAPEEIREKLSGIINQILETEHKTAQKQEIFNHSKATLDFLKEEFKTKRDHDIKDFIPDYRISKLEEDRLAVVESEINRYNKQLLIDFCTNCGKEFKESDKTKTKQSIKILEIEQKGLEETIERCSNDLQEIIKEQKKYNDVGRTMSNLQTEILQNKNVLQDLESKKNKFSTEDSEYKVVQKSKKTLIRLEPKILEYNQKKSKIEDNIANLKHELKYLEKDIIEKTKEITIYKEKFGQLEILQENNRILKIYKDIIHKDGLPLYILKSKIKSVNDQINLIVNQIFDFDIEFVIDEDAGELSVNFIYDGDKENNDVSLASGAETFIINLCIKVGLSQVSELPKMSSLIIDEGYGTLDKETIDKIPGLFLVLSEYYKNIITISHLDEIKDMCQHQIKLEKIGKYTNIIA